MGSVYVRIKNKNEKLSSGDTFVFNKIILIAAYMQRGHKIKVSLRDPIKGAK